MDKEKMLYLLSLLNDKLKFNELQGQLYLYGGAVMCLVLNARSFTEDIDAIFEPRVDIRRFIEQIAEDEGVRYDWLNDGMKGFLSSNEHFNEFDSFSNLDIMTISPEYLFAMKVFASRIGNKSDISDIEFLIRHLEIKNMDDAFAIIEKYYPLDIMPPRARYVLADILGE